MFLLPASLFALVQSFLVLVEAQQQLTLGTINDFNTTSLPSPPTFSLPSSSDTRFVSVALCAESDSPPRFFVTNDTSITQPSLSDVNNITTFEILVGSEGFGSWSGLLTNGGILAVEAGSISTSFELLVSTSNATNDTAYPLFGDTTANQALIFSPPFDAPERTFPTFPNYTLPPANLTLPSKPSSPPNYSLVYVPTDSSPLKTLPRTGCAIRTVAQKGTNNAAILASAESDGLWLRDPNGWRWEWFLSGLTPRTNYTAYTLQDGQLASSRPIMFVTKSASFECPLVHSLPFCPTIAYAVPLPPPRPPTNPYTSSTLPSDVVYNITSGMTNFTTALTTLACGRDNYSPLVSCSDCEAAYRTWLCTISFPRCGEAPSSSTTSSAAASTSSSFFGGSGNAAQQPLPALTAIPAGATPRNPVLPAFNQAYDALLPCLEVCNAADRVCPIFLGFKCPLPRFTASRSYGVGFIDSGEDGEVGNGATGVGQDMYGNVYCNGP